MQKVSNEYKESMKSSLRERGYIMISFGLINQEAQANARIDEGEFAYYSNRANIFGEHTDDTIYATLEENFTKVDGSMFFLPRNSNRLFYDTGLISKNLVSEGPYEITIDLHLGETDFKGLTVNFGENYPIDFDLIGSNGQTIEFRDNTQAVWSTEEVVENTTYIKLIFYRMKNPQSRLRIYSILFGYGLVYHNDSVIGSSLESYISPIGADVPQIDFSVQIKNNNNYFNVDNPKSAINFLETGQEMQISYGYQLPSGGIEWVGGSQLLCSDWESDDYTATIRCQDIFRNMTSEYYKGAYSSAGRSYYDLANEVMIDAGLTDYYIDPRLKNLYSKNPIPRVMHKEALQIIANACRCVLSQTRQGTVQIKSSFLPDVTISSNGEDTSSNIENVLNDSEYDIGYISDVQSDDDGNFSKNPVITLVQEAACMYYGVKLVFGETLPAAFIIHTYNNGESVTDYEVGANDIQKTTVILNDFDDFDKMEIEFTKTAQPHSQITLNHFSFGDITDFTMTRTDMTSSPKAIKQELVKEVIVPCYSYQNGVTEENLVSEDVDSTIGEVETYYMSEPSYSYRVLLDEVEASGVSIVGYGNYYITVRYSVAGAHKLDIMGYRYKIVERYARMELNSRGKTVKWENPLISDMTMANDLAQWLSDYYASGIEYEYTTRGNPELDANDIVYQENEFSNNMKVNIYQQTLNFKQSFSGKVTARRIGG